MVRFRKYRLLMTISFFSFCLCSCFNKTSQKHYTSENPRETLTLALRSGTYSSVIKQCVIDFEKKYNIKCDILELSEDALHQNVANDTEGKYDLCMVDGSWMAEYTAKGLLANLSQFGYELDEDIIPATKTICYKDGDVYLAPYYGNVTVLLYNKLMVKEAGFKPEEINSVEELLKICRFQKKRHNLGFMFRGDTENNIVVDFLPILLSRGTYVVDENNKPTIDTEEFSQAIYIYKSLIKTGRAAKKDDLIAAIANKSAAFGIGWPGWYTPTKNSSMDYIALTGRYRNDYPAHNANIYGIWTIGIPQSSRKKEFSIQLLNYLMDKNVQKNTVAYGGVPCRYSSLRDQEILAKFPQYKAVCSALEGGVYRPVMQEWSQFYTILGKEMRLIINENKPVPDALQDAQRELEEMLKK